MSMEKQQVPLPPPFVPDGSLVSFQLQCSGADLRASNRNQVIEAKLASFLNF